MEEYQNLVGNQEDWANYITTVEMRDTPFLDWLPVGSKPVNAIYSYQSDGYNAPRQNAHVDGQPWVNFKSAGENRARLRALVQWLDNTTSVSKLTQDVSNIAGIADELAHDIPKRLKEMATDAEANLLEDWDCREDNKVQGYLTRSVGSWISSTAQGTYPVPDSALTPAASISSTGTGSATEDTQRDIFQSMAQTSKGKEGVTAFVGPSMKRRYADYQLYVPSSLSTANSSVMFNNQSKDRTIIRAVDTYAGDFFNVDLVLSYWNAAINGTATMQKWRTYYLHQSKWEVRWNQKPAVYRPEFKGGSYEAAMDMILMLVCKNPQGEGKYAPTGA